MDVTKTVDDIGKYWNDPGVESMYDKNLLEVEIAAISEYLSEADEVLDIGCGEGEGTTKYFEKVNKIVGLDVSPVRLQKLKDRNVHIETLQMDMKDLSSARVKMRFTKVITQRSLINLKSFDEQKKVILAIHSLLEDRGRYLMLEGFLEGSNEINRIRTDFGLPPIDIKWHNCFFDKEKLINEAGSHFELEEMRDFSAYFFLTRVVNAVLKHPEVPRWDDPMNQLAKRIEIAYKGSFIKGVSRLQLLIFRKK